jgi:hypothetical protein
MSRFDYECSKIIAVEPYSFYGIIMAAMRQADDTNTEKLKLMWPEVYDELFERYHAPGGALPGD